MVVTDRIEYVVRHLKLAEHKGAWPFIYTFKEELTLALGRNPQYTSEDIVNWWDEEGQDKLVSMDSQVEAMRTLTVHKAKGLEFEAVFFVGLDKTIDIHENLWTKYLYVGATRAATYLGITFDAHTASQINSLTELFVEDWDI